MSEKFAFGQFGDAASFDAQKFLEVLQQEPKNAGIGYKKLVNKITVKDEKNVTIFSFLTTKTRVEFLR